MSAKAMFEHCVPPTEPAGVTTVPIEQIDALNQLVQQWRKSGFEESDRCADELEAALSASRSPVVGGNS